MLERDLPYFLDALKEAGGTLGFLNRDGQLEASHPEFATLATQLQAHPDFDQHEALFYGRGPQTGQLLSVSLHRTKRGPGAGGVRRLPYSSLNSAVTDGMRLAIGMGYKNALAGLWWGGGKGVIGLTGAEVDRHQLYTEFGQFISGLDGCYVTAEDVGTKPGDMATIYGASRFTTCIPDSLGGSGNPSGATARGVFMGIEALARHLGREMASLTVALQGLGEVGSRLAVQLDDAGCTLVVFDPDERRMETALALDSRHRPSSAEGILLEEAEIVSPCALGAILNPVSIPKLRCQAICGAANNQLAVSQRDSELLHQRGILYIPDFVVNRMGIVNCADEQYGRLEPDPKTERHLGWEWEQAIAPTVVRLLDSGAKLGRSPLSQAAAEAEARMEQFHPLWPGRAQAIAAQCWQRLRA